MHLLQNEKKQLMYSSPIFYIYFTLTTYGKTITTYVMHDSSVMDNLACPSFQTTVSFQLVNMAITFVWLLLMWHLC